jgi:hypothetical protein
MTHVDRIETHPIGERPRRPIRPVPGWGEGAARGGGPLFGKALHAPDSGAAGLLPQALLDPLALRAFTR